LRCFNTGLRGAGSQYPTRDRCRAPGRREGGNSACGAGNIALAKAGRNYIFLAVNRRTQDIIPAFIAALRHIGILRPDDLHCLLWGCGHSPNGGGKVLAARLANVAHCL
jgi:hypothetical protein